MLGGAIERMFAGLANATLSTRYARPLRVVTEEGWLLMKIANLAGWLPLEAARPTSSSTSAEAREKALKPCPG